MPIEYVVSTGLIFMILFTGTVGVTGTHFIMIHGITLPGTILHGHMHGTGDGVQVGTIDLTRGVGDILITVITALIIMAGDILTMDITVTTTDITMVITAVGGTQILIITDTVKEEQPAHRFTGVTMEEE